MRGARLSGRLAIVALEPLQALDSLALSSEERRVLVLMLTGLSSAEIARRRGRSTRTIANQLASSYRKLGVSSRGELVAKLCAEQAARSAGTTSDEQEGKRKAPLPVEEAAPWDVRTEKTNQSS